MVQPGNFFSCHCALHIKDINFQMESNFPYPHSAKQTIRIRANGGRELFRANSACFGTKMAERKIRTILAECTTEINNTNEIHIHFTYIHGDVLTVLKITNRVVLYKNYIIFGYFARCQTEARRRIFRF